MRIKTMRCLDEHVHATAQALIARIDDKAQEHGREEDDDTQDIQGE